MKASGSAGCAGPSTPKRSPATCGRRRASSVPPGLRLRVGLRLVVLGMMGRCPLAGRPGSISTGCVGCAARPRGMVRRRRHRWPYDPHENPSRTTAPTPSSRGAMHGRIGLPQGGRSGLWPDRGGCWGLDREGSTSFTRPATCCSTSSARPTCGDEQLGARSACTWRRTRSPRSCARRWRRAHPRRLCSHT